MSLITSFNIFDIYNHRSRFNGIKDELNDIIRRTESPLPVEDRFFHAHQGSIKFPDAYALKKIIRKTQPKTVLEVGSFLGFSTRWILETSAPFGSTVTAVDPNIRHRVFDNPRSFVEGLNRSHYPERLEIVTGFFGPYDDGIYYDYETYEPSRSRSDVNELIRDREIVGADWGRKFDFIFIDGDHKYESVMSNFEIARNLLNKGGCIVFHDALSWPDVTRALNDLKESYGNRAYVAIFGAADRKVLSWFQIRNDGLGLFKPLS